MAESGGARRVDNEEVRRAADTIDTLNRYFHIVLLFPLTLYKV